jgi:glycosyltransferase involved in cell wall biosynthesis
MRTSYSYYANLCGESVRNAERWDRVALQKATMVCYCSEWAANDCLAQYRMDPQKVHVVPFGANCGAPYDNRDEAENAIRARSRNQCELLFVGVDWERKGGSLAMDVAGLLNKSGVPTRLTVVGCEPFAKSEPPEFVECLGFLKRSNDAQRQKLNEVFRRSHFFIMPSIAECFGVVYAEASAYGVPSLARDVQGLRTTIKEGNNGWLFPPGASAEPYCEKIRSVWRNSGHYEEIALRAYSEWASRLNWRVAGAQFVRLLEKHFLEKQTVAKRGSFSQ